MKVRPVADDMAIKICAALPGMLAAPHALVCWRPYDRSADGLGFCRHGGVMVPIENVYEQIRTSAADAGAHKVVLFGSRAKVLYEKGTVVRYGEALND